MCSCSPRARLRFRRSVYQRRIHHPHPPPRASTSAVYPFIPWLYESQGMREASTAPLVVDMYVKVWYGKKP